MTRRALAADVTFSWVAADAVYGVTTSKEAAASLQRLRSWGQVGALFSACEPGIMVPGRADIQTLVSVEGHRWAIEDCFETAKNELGLDHNETHGMAGILTSPSSCSPSP